MCTYLGASPFPSLAPCIVTREALLKVVTLLTGRYKRVLKGADRNRNTLLFRSLAVFDRHKISLNGKAVQSEQLGEVDPGNSIQNRTTTTGFSIDESKDEEEDEDDDSLALAALDALDSIEVFGDLHRTDRKINNAYIPVYNLERLLMLMLAFASLTPDENIAECCGPTSPGRSSALEQSARAIVSAFDPKHESISYTNFMKTVTTVVPHIFRPLDPLFAHFLFSRQLDLSRTKDDVGQKRMSRRSTLAGRSPDETSILNDTLLAQMSGSFEIAGTSSSDASSFFHTGARFNKLYSSASDGTSMSSFSRQIMSWRASTLLIVRASPQDSDQTFVIGAYLPDHWKEAGSFTQADSTAEFKATMFQLLPRHAIFRANPYNKCTPVSYFSSRTGIALGCIIPASSRINAADQQPVLGPVSLFIDADMATATFQHDGDSGAGAFLTDPLLEESQRESISSSTDARAQAEKLVLDVDVLEVWGVSFASGEDELVQQQKRLDWEEAEAARRRGVNFGGDKDGARHLLEMAGIVGSDARSGGSMS